jgi:autophagy-related protein 9
MASNIFRLGQPSRGTRSFYEELRAGEDDDIEERAALNVDEENLKQQFHDYDMDHAEGLAAEDSRITLDSAAALPPKNSGRGQVQAQGQGRGRRDPGPRWFGQEDEGDNDVPASLLVESHDADLSKRTGNQRKRGPQPGPVRPNAVPGPSTRRSRAQWETAQAQQRLHNEDTFSTNRSQPASLGSGVASGGARAKALWRWANVSNLDVFMGDVYNYFLGKGMWCILSERALHIM